MSKAAQVTAVVGKAVLDTFESETERDAFLMGMAIESFETFAEDEQVALVGSPRLVGPSSDATIKVNGEDVSLAGNDLAAYVFECDTEPLVAA